MELSVETQVLADWTIINPQLKTTETISKAKKTTQHAFKGEAFLFKKAPPPSATETTIYRNEKDQV